MTGFSKELDREVQTRESLARESESRVRGNDEIGPVIERYGQSEVRPTEEGSQGATQNTEQVSDDLLITCSDSYLQQRTESRTPSSAHKTVFQGITIGMLNTYASRTDNPPPSIDKHQRESKSLLHQIPQSKTTPHRPPE